MFSVLNLSPASLARSAGFLGLFALLASASAWAQRAQDIAVACLKQPEKLPQMTYDEDARYLANPSCRTNALDQIQFIPLGQNENYYVSFGLWIRERGEYVSNPNWSDKPDGNAYLMQRYMLHTDLHRHVPSLEHWPLNVALTEPISCVARLRQPQDSYPRSSNFVSPRSNGSSCYWIHLDAKQSQPFRRTDFQHGRAHKDRKAKVDRWTVAKPRPSGKTFNAGRSSSTCSTTRTSTYR